MKTNEIRKLAKEIRTGNCVLGFEEMEAAASEIRAYIEANKENWTDRTRKVIAGDMEDIEGYLVSIHPVEGPADKAEEAEHQKRRRNYKSVLAEMIELKKEDPVLEAVRWFAIDYGEDTYSSVKCIKGMLNRRGYEVTPREAGLTGYLVYNSGCELVAVLEEDNGAVASFTLYPEAA